jgi:hypothetical protein
VYVDTLDNSKIWKNPNLGTIKANWDASINLRDGVLGLGCVIRNDEGLVVSAKCCVCKGGGGSSLGRGDYSLFSYYFL